MTDSEKLDLILSEIQDLKQRTVIIENNITDIKITLEDEIRTNIQRVAEGHLDLARKLNECIKLSSDIKAKQEIYDIYITMHNNKLKAL